MRQTDRIAFWPSDLSSLAQTKNAPTIFDAQPIGRSIAKNHTFVGLILCAAYAKKCATKIETPQNQLKN
jgi:hypothetical protein